MAKDPNVILFGEEVADPEGGGIVKVTAGLSTKYGARVMSTPISEMGFMGAAIGAALVGMRPVAEIMLMNFVGVCMDQITNHAAKLRFMSGGQTHVPMIIRTVTGSGLGVGGQHADYFEAWFAHVPGLKVVMPSSPADAYGLLLSCIEDDDRAFLSRTRCCILHRARRRFRGTRIPLGKANIVSEGTDVTLICYGPHDAPSLAVVDALAKENISVEVIDLRTIAPFDKATVLASVAKTGRAVIMHEAVKSFGVGAEISSVIHEELFKQLKAPVQPSARRIARCRIRSRWKPHSCPASKRSRPPCKKPSSVN